MRAVLAATDDTRDHERAIAASRHLGIATEMALTLPEPAAVAAQMAAQFEEPIADPGAVSQYALMVAARAHAGAALGGYGAATFWQQPLPGRTPPADSFTGLVWNDHERRGLYTRGFAWRVRDANPQARLQELLDGHGPGDAFERSRYLQTRLTLPDKTLAIAQRVALATGLDLHLPFLDHDVVELVLRCRRAHDQAGRPADPLRAMLARRLPASLLPAGGGLGAQARMASSVSYPWLPFVLHAMVPSVLLAPRFDGRGIVSRPVVRQLWEDHTAGRADHSLRLWSLLMLEFWFREFVDGGAAADEPFEYAVLRAA